MTGTVVDRLHGEFSSLIAFLETASEVSLRSTADDNLRKALLLAAASHFETRMTDVVLLFVSKVTNQHQLITSLVRNKAIARQYHTWFTWDSKNANSFFAMFGQDFRDFMTKKVDGDGELASAIQAFLELGRERNRLVHQDFGSFFLEKTSEEIFALYKKAVIFVEAIPRALEEFSAAPATQEKLPEPK